MLDPKKPFIEFCCMGHETYFTEDFLSEDDESSINLDHRHSYNLSFMPGPYEDIISELKSNRSREEASVQCDFTAKTSITHYSLMPAMSCNANDKVITPNSIPYTLSHTPRLFFPEIKVEKFKCKVCGMAFKNSQALGGHISKKH